MISGLSSYLSGKNNNLYRTCGTQKHIIVKSENLVDGAEKKTFHHVKSAVWAWKNNLLRRKIRQRRDEIKQKLFNTAQLADKDIWYLTNSEKSVPLATVENGAIQERMGNISLLSVKHCYVW